MPGFLEKYSSLFNKPEGRPVGVRNGQGQTPQPREVMNPAFKGMLHNQGGLPMNPRKPQTFRDFQPLLGI